jgi:tRNA G37 N-methylase TrmD
MQQLSATPFLHRSIDQLAYGGGDGMVPIENSIITF